MWNPDQYLLYADERSRPFLELTARIEEAAPAHVVDLGCGPGNLTTTLLERWPTARVVGVDSSAEMIERARGAERPGRLEFRQQDLRDWVPEDPVDVLVSNATLQWVPGHIDLLSRLVTHVAPRGWFAFQVPGNFDQPSHTVLRRLAGEPPWKAALAGRELEWPASHEPIAYLERLSDLGCAVDVWETTYLHVLPGEDAVLEWMTGTGARPVLDALTDADREEFRCVYGGELRAAYPRRVYGTVLPFRRIFVVARKEA